MDDEHADGVGGNGGDDVDECIVAATDGEYIFFFTLVVAVIVASVEVITAMNDHVEQSLR